MKKVEQNKIKKYLLLLHFLIPVFFANAQSVGIGTATPDASAVLEYFAPLQEWLKQQNQGQTCGWKAPAATASAPAAKKS